MLEIFKIYIMRWVKKSNDTLTRGEGIDFFIWKKVDYREVMIGYYVRYVLICRNSVVI